MNSQFRGRLLRKPSRSPREDFLAQIFISAVQSLSAKTSFCQNLSLPKLTFCRKLAHE